MLTISRSISTPISTLISTLMPIKSARVFAAMAVGSLLVLSSLTGCSGKKASAFPTNQSPTIPKDTKTQPAIVTANDQLLVAFNEIGWARQSASLAMNPPNLSSQENCVLHKPLQGVRFLYDYYDCKRESDESDMAIGKRHELSGSLSYSLARGLYQITGAFSSHIYSLKTPTTEEILISQGSLTRHIQIIAPTGVDGIATRDPSMLASSVFKESATVTYSGDVAQESKSQPELWEAKFDGSLMATASLPLSMVAGTTMNLTYKPEADAAIGAKRPVQIVELTATSDITFTLSSVANGSCLRPVGTFNWTIGRGTSANPVTKSGSLTATAAGYTLSTDTILHVWGRRCLER